MAFAHRLPTTELPDLEQIIRPPETTERKQEIVILPIIGEQQVYSILLRDTFRRTELIDGNLARFSMLAKYRTLNPIEIGEIQRVNVDLFESLRASGVLLIDADSGNYYMLNSFNGIDIQNNFQTGVESVNTALNSGINKAMRANGLYEGVMSGNIIDLQGYLIANNFTTQDAMGGNLERDLIKAQRRLQNIFESIDWNSTGVAELLANSIKTIFDAITDEEISNFALYFTQLVPDPDIRAGYVNTAINNADENSVRNIFRLMAAIGDFQLSTEPVNDTARVQALTEEGVLRKYVYPALRNLVGRYPSILNFYKSLTEEFKLFVSSKNLELGGNLTEEQINNIAARVMDEIQQEYRFQLSKLRNLQIPAES